MILTILLDRYRMDFQKPKPTRSRAAPIKRKTKPKALTE
jgi:hypothetical protein